jgi:hypothetical protein
MQVRVVSDRSESVAVRVRPGPFWIGVGPWSSVTDLKWVLVRARQRLVRIRACPWLSVRPWPFWIRVGPCSSATDLNLCRSTLVSDPVRIRGCPRSSVTVLDPRGSVLSVTDLNPCRSTSSATGPNPWLSAFVRDRSGSVWVRTRPGPFCKPRGSVLVRARDKRTGDFVTFRQIPDSPSPAAPRRAASPSSPRL